MANWRRIWRDVVAPALPTEALGRIRHALDVDDARLIQNGVTEPPMRALNDLRSCYGGCLIAYAIVDGFVNDITVGHVYAAFKQWLDFVGYGRGVGDFVVWYDATPRAEMRRLLLPEVEIALESRGVRVAETVA